MDVWNERRKVECELDDDVFAMLIEIAEACHCEPKAIASALLSDVLREDAEAHQCHAGMDRRALN